MLTSMVEVGEATGNIDQVMEEMVIIMIRSIDKRKK